MAEQEDPKGQDTPSAVHTILIVEDETAIGEFLVHAILQETPYQALLAPTALRAMEIMHTLKPDLIVLDYHLPQMNGIAFYDQLQKSKEFGDVPVLLVSARLPRDEVKQRHLPFLHKPFELDELLHAIETHLAERR